MVVRAVEMEGTVTGEHGVGMIKRDYLNHELGTSTVDAMRKVRQALSLPAGRNCSSDAHADEASLRPPMHSELRQNRKSRESKAWRDKAVVKLKFSGG